MTYAIKPSLHLAVLLLTFHLMAASVVLATSMPRAATLVMLTLVTLSLLCHLGRDALLLFPDSWNEISFDGGSISVTTRGGSRFSGQLAGKATVSPYCVLLGVTRDGHSLPDFRAIFPDALDSGKFRELCVHLKFPRNPP